MKKSELKQIIKEVLQENNSLTEEKILIPRRTPEERRKNFIKATQQKIQQYIKNGSKGDLDLYNTPITSLPDNLKQVGGDLDLYNTSITSLPDNLTRVGGWLDLSNTPITKLPDNLTVDGWLDLSSTSITSLPDNLTVDGYLNLSNTPITTLPDNLKVGGWLSLSNTPITKLPDNLTVGGSLYLSNTKITSLSDNLKVGGSLSLNFTPITSLPDNLAVGGNLRLNTKITSIPTSAKITGKIYGLKNENIMKKSELKEMIRECISTMGYVDAKMEREPLSEKVINALTGKKRIVKEETTQEPDYEKFIKIIDIFDEDLRSFLGEMDDWTEGESENNELMIIGKKIQMLISQLSRELLHLI
jgi:hypothetical protein